jgi:hypothetical protein
MVVVKDQEASNESKVKARLDKDVKLLVSHNEHWDHFNLISWMVIGM